MGLSIWHLLLVLAIVLVLFGAKRLRNLGGDLGAAIKGFKDAVTDGSKKEGEQPTAQNGYETQQPQQLTQAPQQASVPPASVQPVMSPTLAPTGAPAQHTTPPHHHG